MIAARSVTKESAPFFEASSAKRPKVAEPESERVNIMGTMSIGICNLFKTSPRIDAIQSKAPEARKV